MKRIIFTSILSLMSILVSIGSYAQSASTHSVHISVLIHDNGDADICEEWDISAYSGITEWYLVESNLGEMDIENFLVSDNGKELLFDGEWDIDRSLEEKAGKYGYVTKEDGYELCWGIGSFKRHVFTVEYTLTNFLKGFSDADGFNQMFIAQDFSFPPEVVTVDIMGEDVEFNKENTRVWSFGHYGNIEVKDGMVKAYSTEPFISASSMIIMVGFDKGMFHPENMREGTFEEMRDYALDNSAYGKPDAFDELFGAVERWDSKAEHWFTRVFGDALGGILYGCMWIIIIVLVPVGGILAFAYTWNYIANICKWFFTILSYFIFLKPLWRFIKQKKYLGWGKTNWYRKIPYQGNIAKSYYVYHDLGYQIFNKPNRIVAAMILRFVQKGILEVVPDNKNGKMRTALKVNDWQESTHSGFEVEKGLYEILKKASGEDRILQHDELNKWRKDSSNQFKLHLWNESLKRADKNKKMGKNEVKKLFGLKQFLKDFTLVEERGMVEVKLWNDYLVFATLFGMDKQVRKDFKKVCPEYFEMVKDNYIDEVSYTTVSTLSDVLGSGVYYNTYRPLVSSSSSSHTTGSSWGGGGGSSWSGGGGFSGGGHGGGGR